MDAVLTSKEGLQLELDKNRVYVLGNLEEVLLRIPFKKSEHAHDYINSVFSDNLERVNVIHPDVLLNHAQISYLNKENSWTIIALSGSNKFQSWVSRGKKYQRIVNANKFYLQNNDIIILGGSKANKYQGYRILFREFQGASPKQRLPPNQELGRQSIKRESEYSKIFQISSPEIGLIK